MTNPTAPAASPRSDAAGVISISLPPPCPWCEFKGQDGPDSPICVNRMLEARNPVAGRLACDKARKDPKRRALVRGQTLGTVPMIASEAELPGADGALAPGEAADKGLPSRANKPRVPLGTPHCAPCVEKKKAVALGVNSVAPVPAPPRSISIIIGARNNGEFLREAIASATKQTVAPYEVIYSDDGSDDDSLAIARSFPGVKVLESPNGQHLGVCAARNRGCDLARGQYLLHLDGDDVFPHRFLQWKLDALGSHTSAFVYSAAQAFGAPAANVYWDMPEWDRGSLWTQNWINTSTLIERNLFHRAGGWREGIGTAWDWDLFVRAGRLAPGIRDGKGFLLYRRHEASISSQTDLHNSSTMARMNRMFRLANARARICCVLSDRVLGLWPKWMERLVECIEEADRQAKSETPFPAFGSVTLPRPTLAVWYTGDRTKRREVASVIDSAASHFGVIEFKSEPWANVHSDEHERRWNVSTFLARAYNHLTSGPEEVVWCLEDDVIPPVDGYWHLLNSLLGGRTPRFAVSGVYRSRHTPETILGHNLGPTAGAPAIPLKDIDKDTEVELSGTGCLAFFKPFAPQPFEASAVLTGGLQYPAHDWNWSLGLKAQPTGWPRPESNRVLLVNGMRCRHYRTESDWV